MQKSVIKINEETAESITRMIEKVAENICDNYCKYRDTCDDNCECDPIRNGEGCPLDMLL